MASRKYDIIILGATGFTGSRVAQYISKQHPELDLCLLGRDATKLHQVIDKIKQQGCLDTPDSFVCGDIPTLHEHPDDFEAEWLESESGKQLVDILKQGRLVINCSGPYRYTGEAVVAASLAAKTDYLDLSGEPEFFDRVLLRYDQKAKDCGVLVVSACAFDCVPAELGFMEAMSLCSSSTTKCGSVEIFHVLNKKNPKLAFCGFATTFKAAVDGFHSMFNGTLSQLRKSLLAAGWKYPPSFPSSSLPRPSSMAIWPRFESRLSRRVLLFQGADHAAIRSTQRYLSHSDPSISLPTNPSFLWPRTSVEFAVPSLYDGILFLIYGSLFTYLAKYSWGSRLLKNHVSLFTNNVFHEQGPSDAQLDNVSFETLVYGKSEDGKVMSKVVIGGPEPGYVATPRIVTGLAMFVLESREHKGQRDSGSENGRSGVGSGVALPGSAFFWKPESRSQVMGYLHKEGIHIRSSMSWD